MSPSYRKQMDKPVWELYLDGDDTLLATVRADSVQEALRQFKTLPSLPQPPERLLVKRQEVKK